MCAETALPGATLLAIFENIGWSGGILILLVILLLFGGKKLPELARGLGKGLRLFKDELEGVKKDIEQPPKSDSDKKDEQETDSKD